VSLVGVVIVKFTNAIARVLKRVKVRVERGVTYGAGVAALFVALLPIIRSRAPTALSCGGCDHRVVAALSIPLGFRSLHHGCRCLVVRVWACAFFRLRASAFALLGEALRPLFLALNFALLRSRFRAPAFLDFLRSSVFRARKFALLDFRVRNFVPVRLYTARTGQPGQYTQNRTGRTGQADQDSQNRTDRTGQQEQDRQNKTALTGEPGQDSQDMKARTGQAGI
jgi:hypothetical protein